MPGVNDANGVYQYAEDDQIVTTFSAFLNKLGASISLVLTSIKASILTKASQDWGVPGGWTPVLKAGNWAAVFSGGVATVTFPAAFTNQCTSVALIMAGGPHTSVAIFNTSLAKTGMQLAVPAAWSGTVTVYYQAVGW